MKIEIESIGVVEALRQHAEDDFWGGEAACIALSDQFTPESPVLDIKPVMAEFLPRQKTHQPDWAHEIMQNYWAAAGSRIKSGQE